MDEATLPKPEIDGRTILIEYAKPDDAEALMLIKRAAWFAAYTNEKYGVTDEDIQKKFTEEDAITGAQNWREGIAGETDDGERRTFVARIDGRVVGFSSPSIEDGQRRIGQLYVDPDFQGHGIGSQLLTKALEWHGADEDVYLHVVKYNDLAIRLYERFGFEETGKEFPEEFDEEQGIKLLPEIEMVRKSRDI